MTRASAGPGGTEEVKRELRRLASGSGCIPTGSVARVFQELGLSRAQADLLLAEAAHAQGVVVDRGASVCCEAFVDWLSGEAPSESVADDAAEDARLRSVLRARRTVSAGHHAGAKFLELFLLSCGDESGPAPPEVQQRMRYVWSAVMVEGPLGAAVAETAQADSRRWDAFARFCIDHLLEEAFGLFDTDSDGRLSAQDLMTLLMLLTVHSETRRRFTPGDAEHIVQEFEDESSGALTLAAFMDMARCLEREARDYLQGPPKGRRVPTKLEPPHLVLYFDVNNTVLVADRVTGGAAEDLFSTTLAGNTWGLRTRRHSGEDVWVQVCPEPSVSQPWQGLISYTEFVVQSLPLPVGGTREETEAVADTRRKLLRAFCRSGEPGAAMRPHAEKLRDKLAENPCKLLPSFYFLLQELKRRGRSFSVVFRTFGTDMDESIEGEFNEFCQGRHPLFPMLVLDGSDGLADHRMDLNDASSTGTFIRNGADAADIALAWGTREQPVEGVPVVQGIAAAAESLEERLARSSRTVVLRDDYAAWSRMKFAHAGGKPLFLRIEDASTFPVFFDDHARPVNPSIIDPIDVRTFPRRPPMAQVYDVHIVRAAPLVSITELGYFRDELERCERAKVAQWQRRRQVGAMLHDAGALWGVLRLVRGPDEHPVRGAVKCSNSAVSYTHWQDLEAVKHSTPFVGIS